jgi:hypothetical protein
MSVDLKKMAGEFAISEHHVSPGDCETFARQVAEACLDAVIYKARIRHSPLVVSLVAMDIQDLKREICGEKEAGSDQG